MAPGRAEGTIYGSGFMRSVLYSSIGKLLTSSQAVGCICPWHPLALGPAALYMCKIIISMWACLALKKIISWWGCRWGDEEGTDSSKLILILKGQSYEIVWGRFFARMDRSRSWEEPLLVFKYENRPIELSLWLIQFVKNFLKIVLYFTRRIFVQCLSIMAINYLKNNSLRRKFCYILSGVSLISFCVKRFEIWSFFLKGDNFFSRIRSYCVLK